MGQSDKYLTFPLAVLNGEDFDSTGSAPVATPLNCLHLALYCGILGAGKGFKFNHGHEAFKARLKEECDRLRIGVSSRPGPCTSEGEILVGAAVCCVNLGSYKLSYLEEIAEHTNNVVMGGPLVTMKSDFFWAALKQARAEADPKQSWPERGISWREFRILAAILSVKINRAGFAFIGWETIQARSCGFYTKEAFRKSACIPDHLAPALTPKKIRSTCDTLENLGFFARFRLSSGARGGLMAYSFRHDRDSIGNVVCDFVNFRDRVGITENRASDAAKCLKLLQRTKSGQSQVKDWGKTKDKGRDKHNEKSIEEKSKSKNPRGARGTSRPPDDEDDSQNRNLRTEELSSSQRSPEEENEFLDDEW